MSKFGIGQPVSRVEDLRLVRGEGRFLGDIAFAGATHAAFVRSPHAHAKIRAIGTKAAMAAPGVLAVLTGEDVARDKLGTIPVSVPRKRRDGSPMFAPPHPGLARYRARFVGDPLVMVIAESLVQAKDAAELVEIDWEVLPGVPDMPAATAAGAPAVWDECPDNLSNFFQTGNAAATQAQFAKAHKIIKRRYVISRIFAHYLETRGAVGFYDQGEDRYTLYADVQYPHRVRNALSTHVFKIPESKIRVIVGDVGGGFGTKGWQYVEHRLVLWAAKKLGRPVKWSSDRSEAIEADEHARDNITQAELALDENHKFLALKVRTLASVGAYVSSERNLLATFANVPTLVGVYDIPAAHVAVDCVLTNASSTAPYRGAGRPEATYVIERLIDEAARELGVDRIELRRVNMIASTAMPYMNALGVNYDCGEFARNMERTVVLADVAGFAARRAQSEARGKLRGMGIANAIERAASPSLEYGEIRFNPNGTAIILMGTKAQGQGHETMFKQLLNDRLGLDFADMHYIDGDTDRVAYGMGTMGSRSTVIGGSALYKAADKVIAKGRKIAAHLLEAREDDIAFADGQFSVAGTNRTMTLKEVARAAFVPGKLPAEIEPGLYESGTFSPVQDTYPNGCHVCEVEIDPETGAVEVVNYSLVDDVGTVMNPIGLKGQIHGGIAQGLGQALMEQVVYEPGSGQLLTGTFMDYAMPRADTTCNIKIESAPVPTKLNPLGAKGAGEAGTVGALPAVFNAVLDALAPLGVTALDMPATSQRVWQAINQAARGA